MAIPGLIGKIISVLFERPLNVLAYVQTTCIWLIRPTVLSLMISRMLVLQEEARDPATDEAAAAAVAKKQAEEAAAKKKAEEAAAAAKKQAEKAAAAAKKQAEEAAAAAKKQAKEAAAAAKKQAEEAAQQTQQVGSPSQPLRLPACLTTQMLVSQYSFLFSQHCASCTGF